MDPGNPGNVEFTLHLWHMSDARPACMATNSLKLQPLINQLHAVVSYKFYVSAALVPKFLNFESRINKRSTMELLNLGDEKN